MQTIHANTSGNSMGFVTNINKKHAKMRSYIYFLHDGSTVVFSQNVRIIDSRWQSRKVSVYKFIDHSESDPEYDVEMGNKDGINQSLNRGHSHDSTLMSHTLTRQSLRKRVSKRMCQHSLPQAVVDADDIKEVLSMNTYMVKGVRGNIHAVTLDPEKCQCPSAGPCYHIMAGKAGKLKLGNTFY